MAEQSKDSQEPKTEAEKKPETVLLTAEELRAIAGGGGAAIGGSGTKILPGSTTNTTIQKPS
jgi:hypothetical protein